MNQRDAQFLISLLEQEYEANQPHTFAATVVSVYTQHNPQSENELIQILKRKYGPPGGNISRVVSKQVFEAYIRQDGSVLELVQEAAETFDVQANQLSDDMLVRGLR